MIHKSIRFMMIGTALTLALLAVLLLVNLSSATPTITSVSGTVRMPDGSLPVPPDTFVWLLRPDHPEYTVHALSQVDPVNGGFSFPNVPPGAYLVRAVPRQTALLSPSFMEPVHVFSGPVTLPHPLLLTRPDITGTVYAPGGVVTANAVVHVYAGPLLLERRTTVDGTFGIGGLPTGTYQLVAEPLLDSWYWRSRPVAVNLTPLRPQYVTLTLDMPQVHGVVREGPPPGLPVPEARVHLVGPANIHQSDETGMLGRFAVGAMPPGPAQLIVEPPIDRGGLMPISQMITLPVPYTITINLPVAPKIVTGTVRTGPTAPVQAALVEANRVDRPGHNHALTDAAGHYVMRLAPGVWALNVHPISTTLPAHWVFPYPAILVQFDDTLHPENKIVDFNVLIADARVQGSVQLPGGGTPPFTVTVGLHTDQGIGLLKPIDAAGHFSFTVPHGLYKLDLRVESPFFAAPPPMPIHARPMTITHIAPIHLIPRDAIITGTLTAAGSGLAVEGVPVIAWNPDTRATFAARSGPGGLYILPVYSDTWRVRPAPRPEQPYVFAGEPTIVAAQAMHIEANVNFTLTEANATIYGVLQDGSFNLATSAYGWASAANADGSVRTGAPVDGGLFKMMVPAGTYSVAVYLPGTQPFMSDGKPQGVSVAANAAVTETFTLIRKISMIRGAVWDIRQDTSANAGGKVWAWDNGLWTGTDIKPGGFYTLPVPAGDWSVDYVIDPQSPYVKAAGPRTFAVPPDARVEAPLPVVRKDGELRGEVLLPDGKPAIGAVVIAEAISPDIKGLALRSEPVRGNGRFTMTLPGGQYHVRAALVHENPILINPKLKLVDVPRGGSTDVTLQYQAANALITGRVTLGSGTPALPPKVHLWAWNASDGFNSTIAPLGGVYTLPVVGGQAWTVVAVMEMPNNFWITRTLVAVPPTGKVVKDLVLEGPKPKPGPVTVVFDATESQLIELVDGTRIFIPAGAMPAEGRVILHITPLAVVPRHHNGDVLGLSYVFEAYTEDGQAITDNFNQDVIITFLYDEDELARRGIDEDRLRPAYFSTTTNNWTAPDSFVVDEIRNEITMQIDHFTQFGVMNTEEGEVTAAHMVFAPLVLKNK